MCGVCVVESVPERDAGVSVCVCVCEMLMV